VPKFNSFALNANIVQSMYHILSSKSVHDTMVSKENLDSNALSFESDLVERNKLFQADRVHWHFH